MPFHTRPSSSLFARPGQAEEEESDDDAFYRPPRRKPPTQQQRRETVEFSESSEPAVGQQQQQSPRVPRPKPEAAKMDRYNNNVNKRRGDYYDEDDDDEFEYYDDDDEEYYDADDEEESGGNYWTNPPARYDPIRPSSSARPTQRVPGANEPPRTRTRPRRDTRQPSSRSRRRATFRSGTPPPPPVVGDFYKQLFWYGFDPDEASSPADKTMFGGTKGKFNGLAFLFDDALDPAGRMDKPKKRRRYYDDDDSYDYDDDFDYYYDDDVVDGVKEDSFNDIYDRVSTRDGDGGGGMEPPSDERLEDDIDDYDDTLLPETHKSMPNDKHYFVTPPNDQPRPFLEQNLKEEFREPVRPSQVPGPRRKRRPRKSPWEDDAEYDNDESYYDDGYRSRSRRGGDDWAYEKVSDWFRDDDTRDDFEQSRSPRDRRRPRNQQSSSPWKSPFDVVGDFLRGNNEENDYKAAEYDRQMGIKKNGANARNGQRRPRRERRGRGYAYRYDVSVEDYNAIVDADVISESDADDKPRDVNAQDAEREGDFVVEDKQTQGVTPKANGKSQDQRAQKQKSRDERALAVERIPPNVPAWGPSGSLGISARMKAYEDALDDIAQARNRLEERKKEEQQAKDDIIILKVDMGVKKRRLAASERKSEKLRETIRDMEMDVEEASRCLRIANDKVRFAQERLSDMEYRHREVLSVINPSKAEEGVAEAFLELQQTDPAARLQQRRTDGAGDARDGDS
ncbi:expressed unknown protein [Seminavis robusta]|uniref:Uncharacterized protein n=1 Tax=Seminavis robusta TaxID=568900 RepID=A0A9N8HH03_9STRA|nr:expressed unknown protein [Seminavis robusta]|eukprot:Sro672_g185000.1 n/a (735) ;mRNA; r:7575-10018